MLARATGAALTLLLAGQVTLAFVLKDAVVAREVLPPAPTQRTLDALSFGDREFLYRKLVLDLQNFGDTGGRVTPLSEYSMPRVVEWLRALDLLDHRADHHIYLAARYFSQTQDKPQVAHLVRYIQEHVAQDPPRKLQWMVEAVYLAEVRARDPDLTAAVADQLATYDYPGMTVLGYQLPAIVHGGLGNTEKAVAYMERALKATARKASAKEAQFMREFIARERARLAPEAR